MTDLQALNERLATWSGFKHTKFKGEYDGKKFTMSNITQPDGKTYKTYFGDIPDFTSDLNAIFKWLVPKLKGLAEIDISSPDENGRTMCKVIAYENSYGNGETPALALCLAIDKLITEEK